MIAIPSRDMTAAKLNGRLAMALIDFSQSDRYQVRTFIERGWPVDRVRNLICERFLAGTDDYLLMIDDDMVPPRDLLAMADHELDIVSGLLYAFMPERGIYNVAYTRDGEQYRRAAIGSLAEFKGLHEVDLVGGACLMIHRRVLVSLPRPWFRLEMDETVTRLLDSEDFYFCRKARAAGFKIHLDSDRPCGHVKSIDLRAMLHWAEQFAQRNAWMPCASK
jgi:GT2 family glycosyltransferase